MRRVLPTRYDIPVTNPAAITTSIIRVRNDLASFTPRERAIVALTIDGYSQEEIIELLDEVSVRAVEGVLHRWRTREKRNMHGGGEPDGRARS